MSRFSIGKKTIFTMKKENVDNYCAEYPGFVIINCRKNRKEKDSSLQLRMVCWRRQFSRVYNAYAIGIYGIPEYAKALNKIPAKKIDFFYS